MADISYVNICDFVMNIIDLRLWNNPKNIKVYIPKGRLHSEKMKNGFEHWSDATNGNISFEYVNDENDADIKVVFKPQFHNYELKKPKRIMEEVIGRTYHHRNNKFQNHKMEIVIVDMVITDNKYLDETALQKAILHEIGHSLGLWHHSWNKQSMMYYCADDDSQLEITVEDINRLKKIYKF